MVSDVSVWRIDGDTAESVSITGLDLEKRLQEILADDISILDLQLMVIGREVQVGNSGRIDILAIDPDGCLVVVELKRGRTPRDVVAQALDYASLIRKWGAEQIQSTFIDYQRRVLQASSPVLIDDALKQEFNFTPEELNVSHRLVIVANELDQATERIVAYLQDDYSVPISVETFHSFRDGDREFLIRGRRVELDQFAADSSPQSPIQREWNNEYYANYGEYSERPWSNGKKYCYIRAGGGGRFKRFLERLPVEGRVWVNIPRTGYVAVGLVMAQAVPYRDFVVKENGADRLLREIESDLHPPEDEYVVAVKWLHAVDATDAVRGRGLFGNQNTVAQPRDPKWATTVEFLKQAWDIE